MKKFFFLLYVVIMSCLLLVACANKAKLEVTGPIAVNVGEKITLVATTTSNEPIVWRSSDKTIATVNKGEVSGISSGEVIIYVSCGSETVNVRIKVLGETIVEEVDPYYSKAVSIVEKMTLEQKVGELFIATCDGSLDDETARLFKRSHVGNAILISDSSSSREELVDLVNNIQSNILSGNVMPGFLFNYHSGASYHLLDDLASIPSRLSISATGDVMNAYNVAYEFGNELRSFGFTATLGPDMSLATSSFDYYSDEEKIVSDYAFKEISGYQYAGVMAVALPFPGFATSRYGDIPESLKSKDMLEREDLSPFLYAIENGLDALMTSHVIFTNYDNTYPATMSYPIITNYLRESVGYDGLVIANYMDDPILAEGYRQEGDDNPAVLAVIAGVDMLAYRTNEYLADDYKAVLNAVKDNTIEERQIDESVIRIILKKNKYDLLENNHYAPVWNASEFDTSGMIEIANKVASESISTLMGELNVVEKNKSILVASPASASEDGNQNATFSYLLYSRLVEAGYNNVTYINYDMNSNREISRAVWETANYDVSIFAFAVISGDRWYRYEFESETNVIVSLLTPVNTNRISGLTCHLCTYGDSLQNVNNVIDYMVKALSGEE